MSDTTLRIYRLVPDAQATDPGWDIAPPVGEVVVRAASPADARIVASQAEPDFPEADALPGDGVSTAFASALRNDKLYSVVEDTSGQYPAKGERAVLAGLESKKGTIKPLEE